MNYDFSLVDDKDSYVSVPPGIYTCRVAEIRPGYARDGSERWSLRLEVVAGEYAGRTAAWDSLTWSDRGVVRVKRVLEALGFDVSGELEVDPSDLQDMRARVQVLLEEWEEPVSGRRQERMSVPYQGWGPAPNGQAPDGEAPVQAGTEDHTADNPF